MVNQTFSAAALPPLPAFTLEPVPDMIPWLPNFWLIPIGPVVVYWIMSVLFHCIDVFDLFPQYRIHPPEEILRRNHATRYEVARDVVVQQILQIFVGAILSLTEPVEMKGKGDYDIAVWATRIRLAQRVLPGILGLLGLNAAAISKNMSASYPLLAGALAGGYYPSPTTDGVPMFAVWELATAKLVYYAVIPALKMLMAAFFLDTWQYFLHRLMHVNRWMYVKFHSRHHRLYVPYAYGALYNHPVEGFLLDTLGASIAFKLTCMNSSLGLFFFCFCSIKTVDDHCGYHFPWDPLQLITNNNAAYHDIHHQTWGIKTNFSQPFFTFWDQLLGTKYTGPRTDRLAEKKRAEIKQ